ncbi:SnoaL-like domain-containing protein [Cladophialophora immunda]|nr:SnoaL-like domain-containing protein [Cladophialophora immunda]
MADTEKVLAELASLRATVSSLQKSLSETQDIQAVQWLLNHYTALHDDACFDLDKRQEWEDLFCEDGVAVYPYGQHVGRAGKGAWAFGGVSYFERCQLLSSNFDIEFSPSRKRAYVRTNCIAQWMKKRDVYDDHFDEGGFYHWILRKEADGKWRIERVHLTITWTTGEDPTGVGPKTKTPAKL